MKYMFRIKGGIKFQVLVKDYGPGSPSSITLGWDTYLLFNSDIVKFERKVYEREAESIVLLIFVLWRCSNRQ